MTARFFFKENRQKIQLLLDKEEKIDNCIEKKETSTKGNFKKED